MRNVIRVRASWAWTSVLASVGRCPGLKAKTFSSDGRSSTFLTLRGLTSNRSRNSIDQSSSFGKFYWITDQSRQQFALR